MVKKANAAWQAFFQGAFYPRYPVGALREAHLRAAESRSLLARAIGFMKMNSSKETHQKYPSIELWQRSFHEHVIRNENDYREIWQYIDQNPAKWVEDRYYEQ